MTVRAEAAAAARRVAAFRRTLEDPPPLDVGAWEALLTRIEVLSRTGDRDSASAAIDAWEGAALRACEVVK